MELHKQLYFTQRESIIRIGKPLFGDCFEAWKYGPVLVAIRQRYKNDTLYEGLLAPVEKRYKEVFDTPVETMKNLTLEEFKRIHEEWKSTGLSIRDYCHNTGFEESKFYYWRKKLTEAILP